MDNPSALFSLDIAAKIKKIADKAKDTAKLNGMTEADLLLLADM